MIASLVSVVFPAFNCEAPISEAIDSALSQDFKSVNIIDVEDGSTDSWVRSIVAQTTGATPPKA